MSILQQPEAVSPDFAEQVDDILAMLDGSYRVGDYDVHAVPGERAGLTPWVFGSSKGQSAQVAGARGLPFVASYHITPATALEAIDAYRAAFTPSAALVASPTWWSRPTSWWPTTPPPRNTWRPATGTGCIPSGRVAAPLPIPIPTSVAPLTDEQLRGGEGPCSQRNSSAIPTRSPSGWRRCNASPTPTSWSITSVTHRHEDRLRSHELIAKRWGLSG